MVKTDSKIKKELDKSRKNETLLARLLENSSQPFGVGYPDGSLGLVNKAFEELTGYSREELKSTDWSEILTPHKFRDMEKEKLEELQRTEQPVRYEKEYIRKDGTIVPIELLVHLVKNEDGTPEYYYSFITDISERKISEKFKQELLEKEQQFTEELTVSNEELQSTTEELQIQRNTLLELNKSLHESQEKFFKAFHANPGAMTISDEDEFVDVNESYAKLTGYSKNELIGHTSTELNIISTEQRKRFLTESKEKGSIRAMEFEIQTKSGEKRIVVSDAESIVLDGKIRIIAFNYDITESKANEEKLKQTLKEHDQLNRTLVALKNSNYAMMHAIDEDFYLDEVCRIIIEDCGHSMVWIGFKEEEGKKVVPVAYSGFEEDYLRTLNITWDNTERGQGPTGTAIRTGKVCICENMLTDPKFKPWREEAIKRGYASSIVLPLISNKKAFGTLNIYSKETNPFSEEEKELLKELSEDISFGITSIRLRTEHEKAEKALVDSETKYHSLYSSMNEGVALHEIIYNPQHEAVDYVINDINPAYETITGLRMSEVVGKKASELYGTGNPPYIKIYTNVAEKGESTEFETFFEPMDKHFKISVISPGKGKFATIFEDITKRKKTEKQRKKLLEELTTTNEELKQSNKELEQFAYITSHDLREPLRMITSFLQLLERRYQNKLDADANEFIGFAVDGAKRLDAMTNDLLQYSKITSEKREIKPVNFEHVLEHALENLKVQIEENNAIITHDSLPIIKGDEKLKVQLFQNIIGNAIKYRSQETPKIHISAKKEKNQYLFSIIDNGIGMPPEHLEKIFTIFQRLHTHEEYEGTGIGLAIAQKIVHKEGGEIWAESEPGKGTTFFFTIIKS
jgi:PAS domain S-box-containing protein